MHHPRRPPIKGWFELVAALRENRGISTDLLNAATELLRMKSTVTKLMNKCQKITEKMTGPGSFKRWIYFDTFSIEISKIWRLKLNLKKPSLAPVSWLTLMNDSWRNQNIVEKQPPVHSRPVWVKIIIYIFSSVATL